jgi:hypothetical protein
MALTDWIVAVLAALALLVSTAAFYYSRRAARAAHRAEAAAQRSASFVASVQTARRKMEEAHAIRWKLTRQGAGTNDLVNIGDKTAYDVRVEVPADMDLLRLPTERAQIPPGGTITLGVSRSKRATQSGTVRVLWRDAPDAPDREWLHPAV